MGFRKVNSADRWLCRSVQVSRPSGVSGAKRQAYDFDSSGWSCDSWRCDSGVVDSFKHNLAEACPGIDAGRV